MDRYVHDFTVSGGLLLVTFDTNPSDAEVGGDRMAVVLSSVAGWDSVEGRDYYKKSLNETHLTLWMVGRSELVLRFTSHDEDRWIRCYEMVEALCEFFERREGGQVGG